jgi:L-alanine-DL-glutamate epimerase-like enolase superfamily enzyme
MALETAWIDLKAQREALSFARFLSHTGGVADRVPVNALLPTSDLPETVDALRGAIGGGITTAKLKVGRGAAADDEVAWVAYIREVAGMGFAIRLDANGSWSLAEALGKLERFAPYSIEYCEQPVASAQLCRLHGSPMPLAADESLQSVPEIARLLDMPTTVVQNYLDGAIEWESVRDQIRPAADLPCSVFVLKPMVLGGVLRARRIARLADTRGISCTVTHLFDGPVAYAACCEFATSLEPRPLASGLQPHAGLSGHLPQIARHWRGSAVTSAGMPGLGIDRKALFRAVVDF